MAKPLSVSVYDPESGKTSTATIEPGNYALICAAPCWLASTDSHANGTTVLTLKGRAANLMTIKEECGNG